MSSARKWIFGAFFYGSVATLFYVVFCIALFIISAIALNQGTVLENRALRDYQSLYYYSVISVFAVDPNCAVFDQDLIYKPKIGRCELNTPEFRTTMKFDIHGRISGKRPDGTGMAVVGDSFSMGWGVNDEETFAAILENMTHRPVYNLAVAGYATYRELLRLEKSGLMPKIDTIIIQYCGNDLAENVDGTPTHSWRKATSTESRDVFDSMYSKVPFYRVAQVWIVNSLKVPIRRSWQVLTTSSHEQRDYVYENFSVVHYPAFNRIVSKFPWLISKKVIVFYTNGPYSRYENFAGTSLDNAVSATFVDLSVAPEAHYAVDGHLNKLGHQQIAEKLFSLVSQRTSAHRLDEPPATK